MKQGELSGPPLEGVRNVEHGRAMALGTYTIAGACVAAALSRLRTRASWILFAGTLFSSFALIQTPKLDRLLHLQALHWDDWALVGLGGTLAGCLSFPFGFFGGRLRPKPPSSPERGNAREAAGGGSVARDGRRREGF